MKIPLIYLCLHKKLVEKSLKKEYLEVDEVCGMMGWVFHLEKKLRYPILKELQNYKLIKRINLTKVQVLKTKIDLNNTSKIYKDLGLY